MYLFSSPSQSYFHSICDVQSECNQTWHWSIQCQWTIGFKPPGQLRYDKCTPAVRLKSFLCMKQLGMGIFEPETLSSLCHARSVHAVYWFHPSEAHWCWCWWWCLDGERQRDREEERERERERQRDRHSDREREKWCISEHTHHRLFNQ